MRIIFMVVVVSFGVAFCSIPDDESLFHDLENALFKKQFVETSHTDTELAVAAEDVVSENEADSPFTVGLIVEIIKMSPSFDFVDLKKLIKTVSQGRSNSETSCRACKVLMALVKIFSVGRDGLANVATAAREICKKFHVQTKRVCDGYINSVMEELVVVIKKINMSADDICGILLGKSCSRVKHSLHNWTLPIPPHRMLKRSIEQQPNNSIRNEGTKKRYLKVLQISDIHLDLDYTEGSIAVCDEPLCCRPSSPPLDPDEEVEEHQKAGYWGDYRDCDIPLRTVEETFRAIRAKHKDIDYVIWTGDIPPHDIWNQTKKSQIELIDIVGGLLDKYFKRIPIFSVVGNHESLPMNSFPQQSAVIESKYLKTWLYKRLSKWWTRWLPEDTHSTIERGAFYASTVTEFPKLKIISLNTNYCNNQNWWILLNSTDPGRQLEWLIEQLTESEQNHEMVQILGHVPPGSNDCIQMWSRNYREIVNRFAHIIKGQFFGHTHNDEFEIFYDEPTFEPTNVAYIGPSITTFGNVNPGYRIYTIEQDTFDILDHHTYFLNLTEANLHRDSRPLHFSKSYSAKKAYGMKNLSPNEWHSLVMRMGDQIKANVTADEQLFSKFYRYFHNMSDNIGGEESECKGKKCRKEILCRLVTAYSHDKAICKHFKLI